MKATSTEQGGGRVQGLGAFHEFMQEWRQRLAAVGMGAGMAGNRVRLTYGASAGAGARIGPSEASGRLKSDPDAILGGCSDAGDRPGPSLWAAAHIRAHFPSRGGGDQC